MMRTAWSGRQLREPSLRENLVIVTSRMNMVILQMKDDSGTISMQDPPTCVAIRHISQLRRLVKCDEAKQIIGLYWEQRAADGTPLRGDLEINVLVFESSNRTEAVLDAISRASTPFRQMPIPGFVRALKSFIDRGKVMCASFAKIGLSQGQGQINIDGQGIDKGNLEMIILTKTAIVTIWPNELFRVNNEQLWPQSIKSDGQDEIDSDSGTDDDIHEDDEDQDAALSKLVANWFTKSQGPFYLKHLQCLWFLATERPLLRISFDVTLDIDFFVDEERQRWKRKLGQVLGVNASNGSTHDDEKKDNPWVVKATPSLDMDEVKRGSANHVD